MKNAIVAEKTRADCSLLPRQGCHALKFHGENFREEPQNRKICESQPPSQGEVLHIHAIRVRSGVLNPGNEATHLQLYMYTFMAIDCLHVYIYPLDFVSLVPRPLGKRPRPSRHFHFLTCNHIHLQFRLVMDCGESSDDVNGSGASSKKWKYETDNGRGGGTGVQYSPYLHMSPS